MRFTLELLGHVLDLTIEHPGIHPEEEVAEEGVEEETEGEAAIEPVVAHSCVERIDPHESPIGFYPNQYPRGQA